MTDVDENRRPLLEVGAITLDCADPATMSAFYANALGGTIIRHNDNGAWIQVGELWLLIHKVEDYKPPTWPAADVPKQMHFEFLVDDLDDTEAQLHQLGATTCQHQPHRDSGNLVMLDPAGHPFCIGTRAGDLRTQTL
jgi:catechol-2,3-dioxygenase